MATTLAEVLRHFGADYLGTHGLSTAQARAWRAIVACRTSALGGQRLRCDGCGAEQWRWHSCRNRHCPQCQSRERETWRAARLAELLDVPYCHLVFTLPHEINALAGVHARWVYETLMRSAAATLTEFAADARWLGGIGAFTLVLHTWTQDLRRHLHVHALMACGALQIGVGDDGRGAWISPRRSSRFLFPVHALSRVFRGKFLQALQLADGSGALSRDRLRRSKRGASGCKRCTAATGWSTPRRLSPDPPRCWITWPATRIAPPSATSGCGRNRDQRLPALPERSASIRRGGGRRPGGARVDLADRLPGAAMRLSKVMMGGVRLKGDCGPGWCRAASPALAPAVRSSGFARASRLPIVLPRWGSTSHPASSACAALADFWHRNLHCPFHRRLGG